MGKDHLMTDSPEGPSQEGPFALLMEDSHGREVLPIGRTGAARQAIHGNLDVELRGIERQPGVRRTL
jgi:uncharacterized protein